MIVVVGGVATQQQRRTTIYVAIYRYSFYSYDLRHDERSNVLSIRMITVLLKIRASALPVLYIQGEKRPIIHLCFTVPLLL